MKQTLLDSLSPVITGPASRQRRREHGPRLLFTSLAKFYQRPASLPPSSGSIYKHQGLDSSHISHESVRLHPILDLCSLKWKMDCDEEYTWQRVVAMERWIILASIFSDRRTCLVELSASRVSGGKAAGLRRSKQTTGPTALLTPCHFAGLTRGPLGVGIIRFIYPRKVCGQRRMWCMYREVEASTDLVRGLWVNGVC